MTFVNSLHFLKIRKFGLLKALILFKAKNVGKPTYTANVVYFDRQTRDEHINQLLHTNIGSIRRKKLGHAACFRRITFFPGPY